MSEGTIPFDVQVVVRDLAANVARLEARVAELENRHTNLAKHYSDDTIPMLNKVIGTADNLTQWAKGLTNNKEFLTLLIQNAIFFHEETKRALDQETRFAFDINWTDLPVNGSSLRVDLKENELPTISVRVENEWVALSDADENAKAFADMVRISANGGGFAPNTTMYATPLVKGTTEVTEIPKEEVIQVEGEVIPAALH